MRFTWRTEWPLLLVVFAMFLVAAATWPAAPARFPIHWNLQGVDGYGSRFQGVFLVPILTLGVYVLFRLLPRIDPGRANYAQFAGIYTAFRLVVLLFLAATYAMMQLVAHGYELNVPTIVILMAGALLIFLGNFMGKIRPNWFCGIRTPWTLSSKLSWDRTHRFGGWVCVVSGVLVMASVAEPPRLTVAICLADTLAMVTALYIYSYLVWRSDPDKQPAVGTMPAGPI
ncbi:MAG TPA: SdpI family protein [Candidatus Binataceae bacterium]